MATVFSVAHEQGDSVLLISGSSVMQRLNVISSNDIIATDNQVSGFIYGLSFDPAANISVQMSIDNNTLSQN